MQATGYRAQGTGHRAQGTGYRVQGTGYGVQGTGYGARDTGSTVVCASGGVHGLCVSGVASIVLKECNTQHVWVAVACWQRMV